MLRTPRAANSARKSSPVATDGMGAGFANNHVKPGDARVIAFTKVIGGGQTTSVKFPTSKLKKAGILFRNLDVGCVFVIVRDPSMVHTGNACRCRSIR